MRTLARRKNTRVIFPFVASLRGLKPGNVKGLAITCEGFIFHRKAAFLISI